VNNPRLWAIPLVVAHLLLVALWVELFRTGGNVPEWMIYLFWWSVFGIQFTWGFTVGLMVGPARAVRAHLWWSALTAVLPGYLLTIYALFALTYLQMNPIWVLLMYGTMLWILACETFCGVLAGASAYIKIRALGRS